MELRKLKWERFILTEFLAYLAAIVAFTAAGFGIVTDNFFYVIIFVLSTALVMILMKLMKSKPIYQECPYCNKSILIAYNWTCDWCHNEQNQNAYIYAPCVHCRRKLTTFFCQYCDKEISLAN